jgi:hypothetical protein
MRETSTSLAHKQQQLIKTPAAVLVFLMAKQAVGKREENHLYYLEIDEGDVDGFVGEERRKQSTKNEKKRKK